MTSFQSTSQLTLFCTCEGLHILCLNYLMLAMLQKMQSGHKGNYHFILFSRMLKKDTKRTVLEPGLISLFTLVKSARVQKILIHLVPSFATWMERLDTKSSTHTKQPFISSILPQFSIQKYQKHRL